MRDRLDDLSSQLAPAEGLEAASQLFSSPPIESLEWLKELGVVAKASLMPSVSVQPEVATPSNETPAVETPVPVTSRIAAAPESADAKLLEALLEYHRLRGPTLGARSGVGTPELFARSDSSTISTREGGFSSIEIPVIENYIPKTSASPHRSSQPVHTVLKSKPRP